MWRDSERERERGSHHQTNLKLVLLENSRSWDFCGELKFYIMWFISYIFMNKKLVKDSNCSFIALIPNVTSPSKWSDFRTISLDGCIYKILFEVLSNRLKLVIDNMLSEAQMTFVKGCKWVSGRCDKRKKDMFMLKFDFEKAYDFND